VILVAIKALRVKLNLSANDQELLKKQIAEHNKVQNTERVHY
jgi:hypothetical protein